MSEPLVLVWLAVSALGVLLVVAVAAFARPRQALATGVLLVLVAGTKLRGRAADASLNAELDWQVAIELALFGALAVITTISILFTAVWRRGCVIQSGSVLLAYAVLCAASAVWSLAPGLTAVRAFQLITLAGFTWASVEICGAGRTLQRLSRAVIVYVLICSAASLVAGGLDQERFTWFAVHPITAATFAGLGATFVVGHTLFSTAVRRPFNPGWLLVVALVLVLLLTSSRGPLLAFLAAAAVLLLKRTPSPRARLVMALSAVLVIVTSLTGGVVERAIIRAAGSENPVLQTLLRGQDAEQFLGMTGRAELWGALMPLVRDRPLLGYGYQGSRPLVLDAASWAAYAHNAMLQTLLDVGTIGAVLLLIPVASAAYLALRRPLRGAGADAAAVALGGIVFLLVNGITSESFAAAPGLEILVLFIAVSAQHRWADAVHGHRVVQQAGVRADLSFMPPGYTPPRTP